MSEEQAMKAQFICTMCGVDESYYWRGLKAKRPLCNNCYPKVRRSKLKKKKEAEKIYSMWGDV